MEPNVPSLPFVERRSNEEFRKIVDDKVAELDARRESQLRYKLDAIEKLFGKTVETKAEALTIAVRRIQGDGTECANRCRKQVNVFYKSINEINANIIRVEMIIETLSKEVEELEKSLTKLEERVDRIEEDLIARSIRITDLLKDVASLHEEIATLKLWKETDFKRSLIITVVSLIASITLLVPAILYVIEHFTESGL